MKRFRASDQYITNPGRDLLGMKTYARQLAHYIKDVSPPFTIGVYGEWGSGKTSFVHMLRYFLFNPGDIGKKEDEVKFITFSAWPHVTADALWRALIMKIAGELYNISDLDREATEEPQQTQEPSSFYWWLNEFLTEKRLVVWKTPPHTPRNQVEMDRIEYKELVAALDGTSYGSVSRDVDKQFQIDQEVAIMSIINAAIGALGSISPLVSLIRDTLGMSSDQDITDLLHKEKNRAKRKAIESVKDFKTLFQKVFDRKASDYDQIFVFIDDLDRCLPDVALDLLEAVKIFLDDVPCIFIVAADEDLIGQGLRLRYTELLSTESENRELQYFFAQKGQEYFEKIIQFGVRIPPTTADQTRNYITALFPQWMSAADIIQISLRDNPRKLKQYCNLLSYRYQVSQMEKRKENQGQVALELFDKLIALRSWNHKCVEILGDLTNKENYYQQIVTLLNKLKSYQAGNRHLETNYEMEGNCHDLYLIVISSEPLRELLITPPHLSDFSIAEIRALIRFSDIKPHPETMLQTQDPVFMRILRNLLEKDTVSIRKLVADDFSKLMRITRDYPDLGERIFQLAQDGQWTDDMPLIESCLESDIEEKDMGQDNLSDLSKEVIDYIQDFSEEQGSSPLNHLLMERPRLSSMLAQEVNLYNRQQDIAPSVEEVRFASQLPPVSISDRYHRAAEQFLPMISEEEEFQKIRRSLGLRLEAAQRFLELRKFAKLDTLSYQWDALAKQLRLEGLRLLKELERYAVDPESTQDELPEAWNRYLQDKQLTRFLKLRPLFRDIYPQEVQEYFAISPFVSHLPEALETLQAESPDVTPLPLEEKHAFQDIFIKIEQIGQEQTSENNYRITIEISDEEDTGEFTLSPALIQKMRETVEDAVYSRMSFRRSPIQHISESSPSVVRHDEEDIRTILRYVGTQIYKHIFVKSDVDRVLCEALKNPNPSRIVLNIACAKLRLLPWECVYIPSLRLFPALMRKYSLVHYLPGSRSLIPRTLTTPLRILVALASPIDSPPLHNELEKQAIIKALDVAIKNNEVELKIIDHTTQNELRHAILTFQPHFVHFSGHSTYMQQEDEGALLLENSKRQSDPIRASELKTILVDSNISVAVLNGCDTARSGIDSVMSGVAGSLVMDGIPAAIATTRTIFEPSALMFTREFYQAFMEGYSLEPSIVEARKALSVENWDWSVYTLYSGTTKLESMRIAYRRGRSEDLKRNYYEYPDRKHR